MGVYSVAVCAVLLLSMYLLRSLGDQCSDDYINVARVYASQIILRLLIRLLILKTKKTLPTPMGVLLIRVQVLMNAALFCALLVVVSYVDVKSVLLSTFEDRVMEVKDVRMTHAETSPGGSVHMHTEEVLIKFHRYYMEDVELNCSFAVPVSASPYRDRPERSPTVDWLLDGKPVKFTDKYSYDFRLKFRPPKYSPAEEGFVSHYDVYATLSIRLLDHSNFGIYTCRLIIVNEQTSCHVKQNNTHSTDENSTDSQDLKACTKDLEYVYSQQRFEVTRLGPRLEQLFLKPGSVLSFTSIYWHLDEKNQIQYEHFFVKAFNMSDEFPIYLLQRLLYWSLTLTKRPGDESDGEVFNNVTFNLYGIHRMRYLRRYYNRTLDHYQLIEIQNPLTLLVMPDYLQPELRFGYGSLDSRFFACSDGQEKGLPLSDYFVLVYELADCVLASIAIVFFIKQSRSTTRPVPPLFSGHDLTLGLPYREAVESVPSQNHTGGDVNGSLMNSALVPIGQAGFCQKTNHMPEEHCKYDVFLSYAEAEAGFIRYVVLARVDDLGYRTFFRDRDVPPNRQELSVTSDAVESSGSFILFLSQDYLIDNFRVFEADMILTRCLSRPPIGRLSDRRDILVIRLTDCEIPPLLRPLLMYDWTSLMDEDDLYSAIRIFLSP